MKPLIHHLFFITLTLAITCMSASAQYYPAGLGNSNLALWLTAADPTTLQNPSGSQAANGDFIAKWIDKSGNNHHAVQATSGTQPVLKTNALNGNSAVIFQNTSEYMTGPTGAYQTIVSARTNLGSSYQYLFSSPALTDFSIRYAGSSSTGNVSYTDGPNGNDWCDATGSPSTMWINGVQSLTGTTATHILVDEAASATNNTYSISNTFMSRGMYNNDPVYELIAYSSLLNNTQRRLLENYEAAAWNLESQLPTSGYTIFNPPSAASFNKNLVGIGYTSSTDNVLSNASGATDGLGFSSSSGTSGFLNTAGFLMAAHNGQSNAVISPATIPGVTSATSLSRWNRSWYMQESGGNTSGQVTVNFNFADYNGSSPNPATTYSMLYNATDGSFATGTNSTVSTLSTTVSGGTVSFAVTASNLPNGYYSIVYSTTPVTLPVVISDFTVSGGQQGSAVLDWTIQDGTGIDHFNVEHSTDGNNFSLIGAVQAQTDAPTTQDYTYIDSKPAAGLNYYRLEIVNTDGSLTYSGIRTFDAAANLAVSISMYPIPTTDMLHILTTGTGQLTIAIFDAQGRMISRISGVAGSIVDVPVSNYRPGAYFVQISSAESKYTRSFIKE